MLTGYKPSEIYYYSSNQTHLLTHHTRSPPRSQNRLCQRLRLALALLPAWVAVQPSASEEVIFQVHTHVDI